MLSHLFRPVAVLDLATFLNFLQVSNFFSLSLVQNNDRARLSHLLLSSKRKGGQVEDARGRRAGGDT